MTADELSKIVAEANKAADRLNDFYAGLGVALEAMLVSPDVIWTRDVPCMPVVTTVGI